MKLTYILFLSLKNLFGHKLRTILTAGGVAISVGFVVFLISLGYGLQRISTEQIANLDALKNLDVTSSKSKIVYINDDIINKFSTLTNVVSAQPMISNPTKITFNKSEIDGVAYGKNTDFIKLESPKLATGRIYTSNNDKEVLVNSAALSQFGIKNKDEIIGKTITLSMVLKSDFFGKDKKPLSIEHQLKVDGVIDDTTAPFVYMPLNLLVADGVVNYSGAKIRVQNKEDIDKVKTQVEDLGFKGSSIKETVDQINQFFSVFQLILLSFGTIAIIVACLGMFNTLTISLLEKTREVGFMKALGTTKKDVYWLFVAESLLIGLFGSALGVIGGVAIGNGLNLAIIGLAKATGNQAVQIFYTPTYLAFAIIGGSMLISYLTGLYPSFRAAKINPLDALRYE